MSEVSDVIFCGSVIPLGRKYIIFYVQQSFVPIIEKFKLCYFIGEESHGKVASFELKMNSNFSPTYFSADKFFTGLFLTW